MKNPFSRFREMIRGTGTKNTGSFFRAPGFLRKPGFLWKPWLWLFFHLGIPLLLGLSLFFPPPLTQQLRSRTQPRAQSQLQSRQLLRINTQLMEMLPRSGERGANQGAMEADRILGEKTGREAIVLAAAKDFESAKKGAVLLYENLKCTGSFEKLNLFFDAPVLAEFSAYLNKYRFVSAGKKTLELLESGKAGVIAEDALAVAYGAFNYIPLDNIDRDPFLLAGRRMEEFLSGGLLSGGSLGLKDDVLAARKDDAWYVLLRLTLKAGAVSLSQDKNAVGEIYAGASAVKRSMPGLEFYFSGLPFHSYESSSSAQKEISRISSIMLLALFGVFLFVFRSSRPVILSMLSALVSLALAAAAALLVFREIHIITFVFGTTLIGTCVDYSIHFFIHWKGNPDLKTGFEIRSHLSKSMLVCISSTEICFFAFLFAPYPILKQFAVFSMTGLFSSFLTAYCIFPLMKMPDPEKRQLAVLKRNRRARAETKRPCAAPAGQSCNAPAGRPIKPQAFNLRAFSKYRVIFVPVLAAICLAIIFLSPNDIRIENDIRSLYTMSAFMKESEKKAAQVLDLGSSPWYFIVSGGSEEETLQNEEKLAGRLEEEVSRGNLKAFLGTSLFVPSIKSQKKTYEAMKALLPLVPSQYEYLGFSPEYAETFYSDFAAGESFCLPEDAPPQIGISNLWIGNIGGKYCSCVLPLHPGNEALFRSIAAGFDFVSFIYKVKDISADLDTLTRAIGFSFLAAYLLVCVLVFLVYPWRDSVKICIVPVFLVLAALAGLTIRNIPLGFFSIAALVLVFGLGLDYIIYMTGSRRGGALTSLGVFLSFLTTLFSFGVLVLSSFVPVHIFGFTVSVGLGAAFISAMLLSGSKD